MGHPLILTKLQKKLFAQNAQSLISASLRYSTAQDATTNTENSNSIAILRIRLQEMSDIANIMFSPNENSTTYLQSMNYYAKLINLVDLMAYKIEGKDFHGFFSKKKPYHSEADSQPLKPILLQDFLDNQNLDKLWMIDERFKPNGVFIPVFGEISIIDFNRLVGSGILLVGLSEKTLTADGTGLALMRSLPTTMDTQHHKYQEFFLLLTRWFGINY